jgi:hypothetical protein
VAGSCEYGDDPASSRATELASLSFKFCDSGSFIIMYNIKLDIRNLGVKMTGNCCKTICLKILTKKHIKIRFVIYLCLITKAVKS